MSSPVLQPRQVVRRIPVGAEAQADGSTHFRVWAPHPREVGLVIEAGAGGELDVALEQEADGFFSVRVPNVHAGARYWYRLDGRTFPDPASRFQPDGPFGPPQVIVASRYRWHDALWRGISLRGQVLYEVHVGTFTREGTWRAAIARLGDLARLGVTTVEVMPVAEFPGRFGWGYDGVFPYAPTRLYGSPDEFRAFVDAAHGLGLGVILDVVYNHLGPSGCVHREFAPAYFSRRHDNEWGDALNFDGADSAPVRVFQGQRYAWQQQPRGNRTDGLPPEAFVTFIENHDQVANTGLGARLHQQAAPGAYRAVTALLLLLPSTPMLFQRQEFGSSSPFLFFADHDGELAEAVRAGRATFVAQFPSLASPDAQARLPVPHDPTTFERCKLRWNECRAHTEHRRLHEDLLAVRRSDGAFRQRAGALDGALLEGAAFVLRFAASAPPDERLLVVNLGPDLVAGSFPEPLVAPPPGHAWRTHWSSEHVRYGGTGAHEIVTADGWRIPGQSATLLAPARRRAEREGAQEVQDDERARA
jgi:1,4-alpha-glucan branching enzyme